MPLEFDDVLSAICTEVTPAHVNDFQKIYMLTTSVEAKLAFDILIALGFDAKVYHAADKPSKLYISNPKHSPEQLEQLLSTALGYAHTLKKIKLSLDELCDRPETKSDGFTIAFVNSQGGKQILIQIAQAANPASNPLPANDIAVPVTANPSIAATATSVKISSSQPRAAKKMRKVNKEDDFATGPAVGRGLYPAKIASEGGTQESLRKRILLRMFGNFATSGYAALLWLVVAGVAFSFFVFAKGWLCYDFVSKRSTKWYCQDPNQISAEEARKLEQQERQRQLGLQPVEPQK